MMTITAVRKPILATTAVYTRIQRENQKAALSAMGDATLSRSRITAPKRTKKMVSAATVERNQNSVEVVFGKSGTEYASVQELRQHKNYTTPNTGPHFLKNAGDSVKKQGIDHFMRGR